MSDYLPSTVRGFHVRPLYTRRWVTWELGLRSNPGRFLEHEERPGRLILASIVDEGDDMLEADLPQPCPACGEKTLTLSIGPEAELDFSSSNATAKLSIINSPAVVSCGSCGEIRVGRIEDGALSEDGKSFVGGHFVETRNHW